MFTLFAAQLSADCFGICGTSCVLKRSHWICKSIAESRRMCVAVDLETSGLRPRQDAYVQHVPQYTSGFHESMCEGGQTRMASILVVDDAHSLRRAPGSAPQPRGVYGAHRHLWGRSAGPSRAPRGGCAAV